mmetsp:Transcript_41709/g.97637  ORF Transcript_41709/g.97637 Transcript_41709/m.97637 type:complete len:251 (-) Transcript_41709:847-1599(-)
MAAEEMVDSSSQSLNSLPFLGSVGVRKMSRKPSIASASEVKKLRLSCAAQTTRSVGLSERGSTAMHSSNSRLLRCAYACAASVERPSLTSRLKGTASSLRHTTLSGRDATGAATGVVAEAAAPVAAAPNPPPTVGEPMSVPLGMGWDTMPLSFLLRTATSLSALLVLCSRSTILPTMISAWASTPRRMSRTTTACSRVRVGTCDVMALISLSMAVGRRSVAWEADAVVERDMTRSKISARVLSSRSTAST